MGTFLCVWRGGLLSVVSSCQMCILLSLLHLTSTPPQITLSGLLNFIDGLWSSCGDERIIVFTTNHKDCLDPALLRPGRMDLHIHMSYCTFDGFKTLAFNYLKKEDHTLFEAIKELLATVQATPAEIAEQLMKNDDAEVALQNLITFLQNKKHTMTETE